jgi:hypothetical protein
MAVVGLADLVNGADVRMGQPRGRLGLADEPLPRQRILVGVLGEELERTQRSSRPSQAL